MFKKFQKWSATSMSVALALGLITGMSALPVHAESAGNTDHGISKVTATFYGDTKGSKGFTWYTSKLSTKSTVQVIKKTASEADFTSALTFEGTSSPSTNSAEELVHKAVATGLQADTAYYYRVGDAARGIWSETGTFQTAPKSGEFTFIDLADTQAKSEDEAILSSQTLEKALQTVNNAQFVVHNGDIVDTGTKEEQWDWLLGHSQKVF